MESKLQLRIQRYGWDAAASVYEEEWQQHLAPAQLALLDMANLQPGMKVIETAAGTGLITFPAADKVGSGGKVLATDISGKMVNIGDSTAERLDLPNVKFKKMNAQSLDCKDDCFDRALCALGLMYMPDPGIALKELNRVLRPGGLVSAAVWGERRNCGWADIFPIVDSRVHSKVCPFFFGLGAPGALVFDLEAAGFSDVQERRIKTILSFANANRVTAALIDGGAVALAAKRFDEATRRAVENEFLESVETYRYGERYEIPGEFVVATGVA